MRLLCSGGYFISIIRLKTDKNILIYKCLGNDLNLHYSIYRSGCSIKIRAHSNEQK